MLTLRVNDVMTQKTALRLNDVMTFLLNDVLTLLMYILKIIIS